MLRKLWLPTFLTLLTLINLTTVLLNRPNPVLAQEGISVQAALGTAFTYQGRLTDAGGPVNAACDFQFSLFDAVGSGSQVGNTQTTPNVTVNGGLFTAQLNGGGEFGPTAFTGEARWLQIAARCPAGSGNFTLFDPRQPLTAAPYALFSRSTGALNGYPVSSAVPANGQVLKWNGSQWSPQPLGVTMVFTSGNGINPLTSLNPIGPQATVTVANGQKVLVIANKALGSFNVAGGGVGLSLWICYKQIPNGSLTQVGIGSQNLRVPQNTRALFGLSAVLEGLNGTYEVGLCGSSSNFSSWNDNNYGYTTALVSN